MDKNIVLQQITTDKPFRKQDFRKYILASAPETTETNITWILHELIMKGDVVSLGYGSYLIPSKKHETKEEYQYPHNEEFLKIEQLLSDEFSFADFQMWELVQLNDFVNHQIAKNIIFIETEKMLTDSIYEVIHERYPYAMYAPDKGTFYRQRAPETDIIIQKLVTESPVPQTDRNCRIEKILVDLFAKKLPGGLVERSEYKAIFEGVFNKYHVDEISLFRYARRRNLEQKIRDFIHTQTNIKLLTETEDEQK